MIYLFLYVDFTFINKLEKATITVFKTLFVLPCGTVEEMLETLNKIS